MPPSLRKAALASRRRCYHGVVRSVPHRGTVNTTPWYCDYHAVVLRLPHRGTATTTPWYCDYHTVVLPVPNLSGFFGTVKWGLTPNRFAGAAPAMHPTWIGKKVNRNSTNATARYMPSRGVLRYKLHARASLSPFHFFPVDEALAQVVQFHGKGDLPSDSLVYICNIKISEFFDMTKSWATFCCSGT